MKMGTEHHTQCATRRPGVVGQAFSLSRQANGLTPSRALKGRPYPQPYAVFSSPSGAPAW